MAYTILVGEDNTLSATKRERIMQRSKLVDELQFLVCPTYKGYEMAECTVLLEYILPVSRRYVSEILTLSEERYEDHLKYLLPFDTNLTSEPGKIELQITFALADIDADGRPVQRVRKTSTTTINIIPIAAWSDIIPDSSLSAIDQRIIKTDAQIKALGDYAEVLSESKADNLKYNTNDKSLQLMSGLREIGDKVIIKDANDDDPSDDYVDIIEF